MLVSLGTERIKIGLFGAVLAIAVILAGCSARSTTPERAASEAGLTGVSCARAGVVDLFGELTDFYRCRGSGGDPVCVAKNDRGMWYDVTSSVNAAGQLAGLGDKCS